MEAIEGWSWDVLDNNFSKGLSSLKSFVEREKHFKIPKSYRDSDGLDLNKWVFNRRKDFKNGKLSPERICALNSIEGWVWDPYEAEFQEGLKKLKEWVKRNNHARVPPNYIDNGEFKLGVWVSSRRRDFKNGKLSPDRIKQLENVNGWIWDPIEAKFQEGLGHLKNYKRQNQNTRIPAKYKTENGYRLGQWFHNTRESYRGGKLTPERVQQLEAVLGTSWK